MSAVRAEFLGAGAEGMPFLLVLVDRSRTSYLLPSCPSVVLRAFGVGEVTHSKIDAPQPLTDECVEWTVSEWTVPLDAFAEPHQALKIGLHIATTCGNDQIEGVIEIPARTKAPKTRDRIN